MFRVEDYVIWNSHWVARVFFFLSTCSSHMDDIHGSHMQLPRTGIGKHYCSSSSCWQEQDLQCTTAKLCSFLDIQKRPGMCFPSPQHFWTEQSQGYIYIYINQIGHVMLAIWQLALTTNVYNDWTYLAAVVLIERHNCSFMNWCFPGRSANHMFWCFPIYRIHVWYIHLHSEESVQS